MNRIIFYLFLFQFICIQISGQNSLNDLNVILKHDFENNSLGTYPSDEWKKDWLSPSWNSRLSETDIIQKADDPQNPTKTLQFNFPINSLGPDEGGANWETSLNKIEELYVSYDLYFMPGFKYQMGGKLPSVKGGNVVTGRKPTGYDGFGSGIMFRQDGHICFYVYYADSQVDEYGDSYTWGTHYSTKTPFLPSAMTIEYSSGSSIQCNPGTWHNLTFRIVLNTVKSAGGGDKNGILEAYFDGKLVTQISHLLFRHTLEIGIDCLRMVSFFGGSTDDWRNPIAEWLKIDNVLLYTYKEGIEVPRGNTLSPTDRTINYWRMFSTLHTTPPLAPDALTSIAKTKSSLTLRWDDKSTDESGFKIFRCATSTGTYTQVGTVAANITSFIDGSLQPGTNYYYKVQAYNNAGHSAFSNTLTAATVALQIPALPTNFKSLAQSKTSIILSWNDNAGNEQGYRIERSLSATGIFTLIASPRSNSLTYTDYALIPQTIYYYRIQSFNEDGNSAWSPIITVTTAPLEMPAAPSGLIAAHIDYTLTTILWIDNAVNETGFEIMRTGPDNSTLITNYTLPVNKTSYTDTSLMMNSKYQFRIRSLNDDGKSAWSNTIEIVTPKLFPPVAPTKLKSTKFTDRSISISWHDNSNNEESFLLTRSLAADSSYTAHSIIIGPDDTTYTDTSLFSSTTYLYTIKAVNRGGSSLKSNKNVATTLSQAELKRIKDHLISYYNFGYNSDYIVYDQSGYDEPLNLQVLDRSAIHWNENNSIDILSNTALVSMMPATKIIQALKETNQITFECWIKPTEPDIISSSRVISLANNNNDVGFLLDQDLKNESLNQKLCYNTRLQTLSTNESGYPSYCPEWTQSYLNLQHMVYTRSSDGKETMYLNGIKSTDGFRPNDLTTWKNDYYLRLGNESDMEHSWKGSFYSVAIYNKALSAAEILTNYASGPCDSILHSEAAFIVDVNPNPIISEAWVKLTPIKSSDFVSLTTLRIMDTFGRIKYQETLFNPNAMYLKQLDFSSYPPGVYVMHIISGNNQTSKKLIVQ